MTLGQVVLILLLFFLLFFFYHKRNTITSRLTLITLVTIGMVLVMFPEITSKIAQVLGIGRGVDLVMYLFIILSLFTFSYLGSQINQTNRKLTSIVRSMAIKYAKHLSGESLVEGIVNEPLDNGITSD